MEKQGLIEVKRYDINRMSWREAIGINMIGLGLGMMVFGILAWFIRTPLDKVYAWVMIVAMLVAMVLHELAHGIFFRIYTGKMEFGIKWRTKLGIVPYASSLGSILERRKMIVIGLAPQIMTIIIFSLLPIISHFSSFWSYSLMFFLIMNFGGGCGDMIGVVNLLCQKGRIFVEDTGTGMVIYRKEAI